jgi:SpoVK/Ycf46/Vps4 family AAA+-type ATPase
MCLFARGDDAHPALLLPDADTRARLWRAHIPARLPARLSEADWASLVAQTEGLADGDIPNAVIYAAALAFERDGPTCTITRADFSSAIEAGKRTRRVVGVAA